MSKEIEKIRTAIKAGYPYFYCRTMEVMKTVRDLCIDLEGVRPESQIASWELSANQDPDVVIETLSGRQPAIMIAANYHWFLRDDYNEPNKTNCSFLQANAEKFTSRGNRQILIIVGSEPFSRAIPDMLGTEFLSIDFELPNEEEIRGLLDGIIDTAKDNPKFVKPKKKDMKLLVGSAKGMTTAEVKNAYAMSLVETGGSLNAEIISELRAKTVEDTAGLKLVKNDLNFGSLKGYEVLKDFTKETIHHELAKGILLLGPAGVGKTHFCRCLGNTSGLQLFEMELAELFGGLVGESEKLMKTALDVIKANAPCIVLLDELEKGLAGVGSAQSGDGGTTKRSMAQLLKFLSDRPEGVYVVATCNDIRALPPEWLRVGRWNTAPWMIDLPNEEERLEIFSYYCEFFGLDSDTIMPESDGWSGAELRSCCELAVMMERTPGEASKLVVPISQTMKDEIDALRKWAKGRTLPASAEAAKTSERSITFD